jgi:hypothetical protein
MKHTYLRYLPLLFLPMACQQEEVALPPQQGVAAVFTGKWSSAPAGGSTRSTLDDAWVEGKDTIGVFMTETGGVSLTAYPPENIPYRTAAVDGSDATLTGFVPATAGNKALLPDDGSAVWFYAYAPYRSGVTFDDGVPIDVSGSQGVGTKTLASLDLATARATGSSFLGYTLSNPVVQLEFAHQLTYLTLNVTQNAAINPPEELSGMTVTLKDMYAKGTFDLYELKLLLPEKDDIVMQPTIDGEKYEAIILPQNLEVRPNLYAELQLKSGKAYRWLIKPGGALGGKTIDSGNHITVNLELNPPAEVKVKSATIADWTPVDGGTALSDATIEIYHATDLENVKNNMAGNYLLMNNIDLGGATWTPIAGDRGIPFTGTFNGNGHTISNYTLSETPSTSGGMTLRTALFSILGEGGRIENLTVEDVIADKDNGASNYMRSGIVGLIQSGGTVSNCRFVLTKNMSVNNIFGGIAGENFGTISNCAAEGAGFTLSAGANINIYAAAICGANGSTGSGGKIYACKSNLRVDNLSGICGYNPSSGLVEACYHTGAMSYSTDRGGIVGLNYGTIKECYATGVAIDANTAGGSIVGRHQSRSMIISGCYYTGYAKGVGADSNGSLPPDATLLFSATLWPTWKTVAQGGYWKNLGEYVDPPGMSTYPKLYWEVP